jgi:hypothetical protein
VTATDRLVAFMTTAKAFLRSNWIGIVLLLVATLVFFGPVVTRLSSYSEGGDAMFNAWTLARDHHCILQQGCPNYADGNIFFPHKDSMFYSESQLSAGLLTLPLHFINPNPIFAYNVWMITSFFLMGFFMYLLAKYLSKGNEVIAIIAGLIFEFAPFRMPAISHMQNISIFYLPLIFLLILKFLERKQRRYLWGLFFALALQFYASWYQMVFVLMALTVLIAGMWLFKLEKGKVILAIAGVTALAALSTLPLAKGYMHFSKANGANFSIGNQAEYSSSLMDYVTPDHGTLLGKTYHAVSPTAHTSSYNTDSSSYYGIGLIFVAGAVVVTAHLTRKKNKLANREFKYLVIFGVIALVGFIVSFGPLLKIRQGYIYSFGGESLSAAIPMPYILVDKFLPQLSFLRALGRAGVLILFSLCCLLAFAPAYAKKIKFYNAHKRAINIGVLILLFVELVPLHQVPMRDTSYSYNMSIPAVYKFIKNDKSVDDIIILSSDWDYPGAGAVPVKLPEQVLWSGYHNKNIFDGYSGYLPPDYYPQFYDYVDFRPNDVAKLKKQHLRYVMVDKQLSQSRPYLAGDVGRILGKDHKVYEDKRFVIYKV